MAYAAASRVFPAKFFIAGSVVSVAVAYLIVTALQTSSVYFLTVSELQARGVAAQSQMFRVSGVLVPGTLSRAEGGVAFQIADQTPLEEGAGSSPPKKSAPLNVTYRGGQVPDIVGDNVEIVAEGKVDASGTFVASTVLAKCPSRLESAPPEEHDYG